MVPTIALCALAAFILAMLTLRARSPEVKAAE